MTRLLQTKERDRIASRSGCLWPQDRGGPYPGPMATILSILALIVAGTSALFAFWAYRASRQSADAATSSERRERQPKLAVEIEAPAPPPTNMAIYRVRNDGPEDLEAIVIFRPRPKDSIIYQLAVTSRGTDRCSQSVPSRRYWIRPRRARRTPVRRVLGAGDAAKWSVIMGG